MYESYIENVKERGGRERGDRGEREGEREREKEKERLKGANKERKMKCNHHKPYDRSESAPLEDKPYTTHTGANPWLSHLNESYIDNVKEREGGREREGERKRERKTKRNKQRKKNEM